MKMVSFISSQQRPISVRPVMKFNHSTVSKESGGNLLGDSLVKHDSDKSSGGGFGKLTLPMKQMRTCSQSPNNNLPIQVDRSTLLNKEEEEKVGSSSEQSQFKFLNPPAVRPENFEAINQNKLRQTDKVRP